MPDRKIRTIVREQRFESEMARIELSVRRTDEFLSGAETILARMPESGHRLGDSNVWFLPGRTVDIALWYTFDDNYVYLLSIEKFIPPEL